MRTRARKFHLPARAPASHPPRPRCAPKSSTARRERPGWEETNPSGVSPGPGGDGDFGCRKPGFRMGQGNKHGKLQPKGAAEPLGRPRKRTPSVLVEVAIAGYVQASFVYRASITCGLSLLGRNWAHPTFTGAVHPLGRRQMEWNTVHRHGRRSGWCRCVLCGGRRGKALGRTLWALERSEQASAVDVRPAARTAAQRADGGASPATAGDGKRMAMTSPLRRVFPPKQPPAYSRRRQVTPSISSSADGFFAQFYKSDRPLW